MTLDKPDIIWELELLSKSKATISVVADTIKHGGLQGTVNTRKENKIYQDWLSATKLIKFIWPKLYKFTLFMWLVWALGVSRGEFILSQIFPWLVHVM